ncbi:MAG: CopG family antitoxin [Verrucomicrobiota bacterium]|nr:CopG family antitoxin [Verrucomicrobiota bacterium]
MASAFNPRNPDQTEIKVLEAWESIPEFSSDEDEARFWMVHSMNPNLLQTALVTSDTTESTTISLRIDPRMLARIKRIARQRYLNYQSMIKQWLSERLEEETKP